MTLRELYLFNERTYPLAKEEADKILKNVLAQLKRKVQSDGKIKSE